MAQKAQVPRGTRDIAPPDADVRRRVANRILDVYAHYGYEVIETPAMEDLDVLTGSQGGENEKLMYKVLRRGDKLQEQITRLCAGEPAELAELGLRFDLTVPLARFVANHLNDLPMPFKVAHIAPVWRAERPQRGRYREFTQCDIDIIGEPGIVAEVELCLATLEALGQLGIDGCTLRVNDRRILRAAIEHYLGTGSVGPAVYIALDKLDKIGPDGVAAELSGHDPGAVGRLLDWLAAGDLSLGPQEAAADLGRVLDALAKAGQPAEFFPSLVRGLGYYTGQVFEVWRPDLPYALAGGGRYDGMTARFGAPALPMCGFSIGFERVCDLVDAGQLSSGHPKLAITCASEDEALYCLGVAGQKRSLDPSLVISVLRRARNVHKQNEDLRRLGYTEIVDGKDYAKGQT